MDKIDDTLIDRLYEVAVDPARYDDLLSAWQAKLESVTPGSMEFAPQVSLPEELMRHFLRADQILVRMGRGDTLAPSPREAIEDEVRPCLLLAPSGAVAHANKAAREAFDLPGEMKLHDLGIDPHMVGPLGRVLRQMADLPDDGVLFAAGAYEVRSHTRLLMILTKVRQPDGNVLGKFCSVDLDWNDATAQTICSAFALTPAETDIARCFVQGRGLGDLAKEKNRSLQTVRTQAKSLLKKTGMRSQLDIVRLFAGLALAARADHENVPALQGSQKQSTCQFDMAGGRVLQVDFAGPPDGDPLILVHGMLTGTGLTAEAVRELYRHNIRLIQPWRGSYATTSPYSAQVAHAPSCFAQDVTRLLDELGLDRVPVAGQLSGGLFALGLGAEIASRVTGVFCLAGPVPITTKSQFASMAPRQRLIAFTARNTPRVLPILLRAGIAQIDSNGIDRFIEALYVNAPWDAAISQRPGIREILRAGYRDTVRQGHKGFEMDSWHVVRDWSSMMNRCKAPIFYLHGTDDPVCRAQHLAAYVKLHPEIGVEFLPGHGHFLLHGVPDLVVERFRRFMDDPVALVDASIAGGDKAEEAMPLRRAAKLGATQGRGSEARPPA